MRASVFVRVVHCVLALAPARMSMYLGLHACFQPRVLALHESKHLRAQTVSSLGTGWSR